MYTFYGHSSQAPSLKTRPANVHSHSPRQTGTRSAEEMCTHNKLDHMPQSAARSRLEVVVVTCALNYM